MTYHQTRAHRFHEEMNVSATDVEQISTSDSPEVASADDQLNLPIVYTVLEVAVAISAVFGNLLVIVVFLQDRRLRKVTNFYIISLSIADLLVGAIGIPSAILTKIGIPRNSIRLCLTMLSLLVVLCTISILNLVAVSLDRYWAILHPLDYHKRISEKTALVIICICWILGSVIGFLPLFGWNNAHLAGDACFFIPIMNYDFLMFLYFVTIVFPALIMAFFYIRIYIVVVQQLSLNKVRQLNSSEFTLAKVKQNHKQGSIDGMSYYAKNSKTLLKLSSPPITPQNSAHRFKSFKSASSPHQLNEIDPHESRMLQCHSNQIPVDDSGSSGGGGGGVSDEPPSNSMGSLSLSGRHPMFHFGGGGGVKANHNHFHRSNHQILNKAEKRKWMSLWSMGSSSLNDAGYASSPVVGDERSSRPRRRLEKKYSTASSIISSFYRTTNGGGNKMSYSRREVKKAQKLFIIVVFFMLCWIPLYTSNTIQAFCHHCPAPSPLWIDFLIILSHINSAGSPFLYAFHMKDFRLSLRRLLCKGAFSKRQLRDLRREELFSISGRRNGHHHHTTGALSTYPADPVSEAPVQRTKSVSDYYLHKGHSGKWNHKSNGTESATTTAGHQHEEQYRKASRFSKRCSNVPRCCVKIEADVEEEVVNDDASISTT